MTAQMSKKIYKNHSHNIFNSLIHKKYLINILFGNFHQYISFTKYFPQHTIILRIFYSLCLKECTIHQHSLNLDKLQLLSLILHLCIDYYYEFQHNIWICLYSSLDIILVIMRRNLINYSNLQIIHLDPLYL